MKKRILIFSQAYYPHIGGAELAVKNITDLLPEHDFDLITQKFRSDKKREEKIGRVNVYRVSFPGRIGRYLYPLLAANLGRKLHRKKKYDIVWSIMAAYGAAASLFFLNRFSRVPFLLTLQEGDPIDHIHNKVRFFRSAWQQAFKKADYIQAISKFLADWARKEGAVCPIEIIPNGVDLEKFTPSRQSPVASRFTIITISRLVKKNAVDVLIQSISELQSEIPNLNLKIVGYGPEEQKLKKLVTDLNIEDKVDFVGKVEPDRLPELLRDADIFVRASRSEGLGSAFLEAMAVGLPVIGTEVGGIPDIIINRETGLFVKVDDPADLANKISSLYNDENLRTNLSKNGISLVEQKYNWKKIASQIDNIFQKI